MFVFATLPKNSFCRSVKSFRSASKFFTRVSKLSLISRWCWLFSLSFLSRSALSCFKASFSSLSVCNSCSFMILEISSEAFNFSSMLSENLSSAAENLSICAPTPLVKISPIVSVPPEPSLSIAAQILSTYISSFSSKASLIARDTSSPIFFNAVVCSLDSV